MEALATLYEAVNELAESWGMGRQVLQIQDEALRVNNNLVS